MHGVLTKYHQRGEVIGYSIDAPCEVIQELMLKRVYGGYCLISEFKLSSCSIQVLQTTGQEWIAAITFGCNTCENIVQNDIHDLLTLLESLISVDGSLEKSNKWPTMAHGAIESLFYQYFC
jgi:hypothetical protein